MPGSRPACFGCRFRRSVGGLGGSVIDLAIAAEEIAYTSADFYMAFAGGVFCALNIVRKGSPEQIAHWIPRLLSGETRMAISISEPDAGSDVGAMRTSAERKRATAGSSTARNCGAAAPARAIP